MAWNRRFSRAVSRSSSDGSWKMMPMERRTSLCRRTRSNPATLAVPALGRMSVQSIRTVVVLPAPFGPRNPNISPELTVKEMPSTAVNALNRRESPLTSIAGVMWPEAGSHSVAKIGVY